MINSSSKLLLLIFSCILIFSGACKRKCNDASNPDCENYDPCYGKKRTSAAFKIEENVGEIWIEGDSVDGGNLIRFTALQDADSFIWKIGAETIYTKTFNRLGFPPKTWINVSLIVINKHPTSCFKGDDGRDTFQKQFYSWERIYFPQGSPDNPSNTKFFPVYGGYWGYNVSDPSKKFLFRLTDTMMRIPVCPGTVHTPRDEANQIIEGVPFAGISSLSPCLTSTNHIQASSPKAVYLYYSTSVLGTNSNREPRSFPGIKAHVVLSRDLKNVEVNYQWKDTIDYKTWYTGKFIGKKIW